MCSVRWIFVLACAGASTAMAQVDSSAAPGWKVAVGGGLGVSLVHATDIVDYINQVFQPPARFSDFASAAEFFGGAEVRVSESWAVKIEYSYLLRSYSVPQQFSPDLSLSYGIHMPAALVEHVMSAKGLLLKLGGGLGYHIATFTQEGSVILSDSYTSKGVGVKLEAEGNTEFDEHLFGLIALDLRDDFMGALRDPAGHTLVVPAGNKEATMSFFSLGLKFGMTYYF